MIKAETVSDKLTAYFDIDEPRYMQFVEGYELDDKTAVYLAVEFKYKRDVSMLVSKIVWLDSAAQPINFSSLPWHEQRWLMDEAEKKITRHVTRYYEQAFSHYELNGGR